ncbi:MAG: leishmanolysin-related zinc metalloendopeptidase, partial [Gemmatimonadaceae bacterium]
YIDGAPSARQQLAVSRAIAKWRSVIVGNTGASRVKLDAQNCGRNWTPAVDEMVTNVLILARIGPIDGTGGIGGDAGPCVLHSSTGLTSFGTMLFDSADLASLESSGLIDGVVAHEMGHVLGVGSLWTEKNLITDLNMADPIFVGASAKQQFALLLSGYSGRPVPVENVGGSGSTGGHWRESVFRNELMTSVINSGTNPLSRVTVASLKDVGYDVSFVGADAFSITSQLMSSASPFGVQWTNDIHVTPLFTSDWQGRLSRWNSRGR